MLYLVYLTIEVQGALRAPISKNLWHRALGAQRVHTFKDTVHISVMHRFVTDGHTYKEGFPRDVDVLLMKPRRDISNLVRAFPLKGVLSDPEFWIACPFSSSLSSLL